MADTHRTPSERARALVEGAYGRLVGAEPLPMDTAGAATSRVHA
jgi:hypothetical protein